MLSEQLHAQGTVAGMVGRTRQRQGTVLQGQTNSPEHTCGQEMWSTQQRFCTYCEWTYENGHDSMIQNTENLKAMDVSKSTVFN